MVYMQYILFDEKEQKSMVTLVKILKKHFKCRANRKCTVEMISRLTTDATRSSSPAIITKLLLVTIYYTPRLQGREERHEDEDEGPPGKINDFSKAKSYIYIYGANRIRSRHYRSRKISLQRHIATIYDLHTNARTPLMQFRHSAVSQSFAFISGRRAAVFPA